MQPVSERLGTVVCKWWHCPGCAVQWSAPEREACFTCGQPAEPGQYVNAAGRPQPRTTSMTCTFNGEPVTGP